MFDTYPTIKVPKSPPFSDEQIEKISNSIKENGENIGSAITRTRELSRDSLLEKIIGENYGKTGTDYRLLYQEVDRAIKELEDYNQDLFVESEKKRYKSFHEYDSEGIGTLQKFNQRKKRGIFVLKDEKTGYSYYCRCLNNKIFMIQNYDFFDNSTYKKPISDEPAFVYTLKQAKENCPDGWDLPTLEELKIIRRNNKGKLNIIYDNSKGFIFRWLNPKNEQDLCCYLSSGSFGKDFEDEALSVAYVKR